jgi:transcriptional regulator with XRE-family HTH domain
MKEFSKAMTDGALAETLFERVESQRKAMKLTQLALAERIGVTAKTYRSLKTGSCSVLILIAVLRELQLVDNLNMLLPAQPVRPTEIWSQLVGKSPRRKKTTPNQLAEIRLMKQNRKKLKTEE